MMPVDDKIEPLVGVFAMHQRTRTSYYYCIDYLPD
jgi:hypothetical protein